MPLLLALRNNKATNKMRVTAIGDTQWGAVTNQGLTLRSQNGRIQGYGGRGCYANNFDIRLVIHNVQGCPRFARNAGRGNGVQVARP